METGLLRQRRNLIAVSCILIVYDFAAIKIKQVGLMGTTIEVGNPAALALIVWVVWFYFFLRYYQYWNSDKDANVLRDLQEGTQERLHQYCERRYNLEDEFGRNSSVRLTRKRIFKWEFEVSKYSPREGGFDLIGPYRISIIQLMWWSLVELVSYCFHKKHMSDHFLPFALAVSALAVKISTMINF